MEHPASKAKGSMNMGKRETPDLLPALIRSRALREPAIAKVVIELAATLAESDTQSGKKYRQILRKSLSARPESEPPRKRGRSPQSLALEAQLDAEREVFTKSKNMTPGKADDLSGELHNLSASRVRALAARARKRRTR